MLRTILCQNQQPTRMHGEKWQLVLMLTALLVGWAMAFKMPATQGVRGFETGFGSAQSPSKPCRAFRPRHATRE